MCVIQNRSKSDQINLKEKCIEFERFGIWPCHFVMTARKRARKFVFNMSFSKQQTTKALFHQMARNATKLNQNFFNSMTTLLKRCCSWKADEICFSLASVFVLLHTQTTVAAACKLNFSDILTYWRSWLLLALLQSPVPLHLWWYIYNLRISWCQSSMHVRCT